MAQYQSFPDASGDSRTLEKLKALKLPDLAGRSFLDVGCNEGFFCGFAKFAGASRSVGLDRSAAFLARARHRFPDCEFHLRDWSELPEGPFDVVLLASALHYAEDQAALLHRLAGALTEDGVLILELGIASSPRAEWVKVKRGIDERYFPSMAQLTQTLAGYAWKWMGPSVDQAGDPVPRHVIHVSRRRPIAYLLMQPPGYGKSSIASNLFLPAKVPVVSGDGVIQRIAKGQLNASPRLKKLVARDYSPFTIDKTIQRVFDEKAGPDLVRLWHAENGRGDFALDGFVPLKYHEQVKEQFLLADYMPVVLQWERLTPSMAPMAGMDEYAESFNQSILEVDGYGRIPAASKKMSPPAGYVDEVQAHAGRVILRGWAVDENGDIPAQLVVGIGAERNFVDLGEPVERKDVQRHLKLAHARLGYVIDFPVPGINSLAELGKKGLSLSTPSGRPLRLAQRVIKSMVSVAEPTKPE
ncbi:class I SAM-dependent methyltransferase [Luteimonas mephitis]|uniref:class I SAM-dependent methyltransferase n=1 Tax=Luteimonas mephitis TaxID=83615 RepID=UPI0004182635|nr:class I SAM-dependent methyltransferase [Luteimonas mephitis]